MRCFPWEVTRADGTFTYLYPGECWLRHSGQCQSGFCFPCKVCVGVCGNLCTFSQGQSLWYTQDSPFFLGPLRSYLVLCLGGWSSYCVCTLSLWSGIRGNITHNLLEKVIFKIRPLIFLPTQVITTVKITIREMQGKQWWIIENIIITAEHKS